MIFLVNLVISALTGLLMFIYCLQEYKKKFGCKCNKKTIPLILAIFVGLAVYFVLDLIITIVVFIKGGLII